MTDFEILAPEDGKYWLIDLDDDPDTDNNLEIYVEIDDSNYLLLQVYNEYHYGDIGVLVTEPDAPRKGRIYLFMHQYVQNR